MSTRLWALAAVLWLSGCATLPRDPFAGDLAGAGGPVATCANLWATFDREVSAVDVADSQAVPVAGFPYLRVSRLLASYAQEPLEPSAFEAWVNHLMGLGAVGARIELANLPAERISALSRQLPSFVAGGGVAQGLDQCAAVLRGVDLSSQKGRAALVKRARVPSPYRTWQRVVGLYPVTALAVSQAITRDQQRTRQVFALPLAELPVEGALVRYAPPANRHPLDESEVARIVARSGATDPLGIAEPHGRDRDRLFDAFAPTWEVDVADEADRIGAPAWDGGTTPTVDVTRPTVYRYVSHTRFGGRALLQLNYTVWFPARPPASSIDLLAGDMDGITWRVTLDGRGRPLIYDTIHNCGCYHMFFPTSRLEQRPSSGSLEEPPLIPQVIPRQAPGVPVTLRVAHRTHYLQRVVVSSRPSPADIHYAFADYDDLRSLPLPGGGRRSLFRPDGLVPGTQRGEVILLWPMGIPAPGAMRQWGHHATAFVGRRYFDEPFLMMRYFEMTQPARAAVGSGGALGRSARRGVVPRGPAPVATQPGRSRLADGAVG